MPDTISLKVVQDTMSLRERTTEVLRSAILSMQFKPGERLVERQLCHDTGVSRTCIRESMRHLEAEGLVRREHNKGIYVSSITAEEANEIYEVRKILEVKILERLVLRISDADIVELGIALAAAKENINNSVRYVETIGIIINLLWEGSGNKTAIQMLKSLFARISYIRIILSRSTTEAQRMQTITILDSVISAIRSRDAKLAQRRYTHYLNRAQVTVVQIIESSSGVGEHGSAVA